MVVFTDVSAQPIGPIFKGQAVKESCMTLKDGTDVVSRNVGKKPQFYAVWNSKNNADLITTSFLVTKLFIYSFKRFVKKYMKRHNVVCKIKALPSLILTMPMLSVHD